MQHMGVSEACAGADTADDPHDAEHGVYRCGNTTACSMCMQEGDYPPIGSYRIFVMLRFAAMGGTWRRYVAHVCEANGAV